MSGELPTPLERLVLAKLDRVIYLLERLVVVSARPEKKDPGCPSCGGTKYENTGSFGNPRHTCLFCGVSYKPPLAAER